jgi:CheY-like chemotaxis protein
MSAVVVIVAEDLMFGSAFTDAARRAGATGRTVRDVARLRAVLEEAAAAESAVALVVLDLTTRGLDPAEAVGVARTGGAKRVIAFGPHVEEASLERAVAAGCDEVLTRGQFHARQLEVLKAAVEG